MASKSSMSRRSFMTSVGTATVVPVMLGSPASAAPPRHSRSDQALARSEGSSNDAPLYLFFNAEEVEFIEAACERLIPADEVGPGALDAGYPITWTSSWGARGARASGYIAAAHGRQGTPMQGYQLPFTPAELFHTAIRAITTSSRRNPRSLRACLPNSRTRISRISSQAARTSTGCPPRRSSKCFCR